MTEHAFIQQIQDEITVSGTLPVVLEDRELQRIIKQQSKWAFENYEQAVESQFYIIPLSKFTSICRNKFPCSLTLAIILAGAVFFLTDRNR